MKRRREIESMREKERGVNFQTGNGARGVFRVPP